MGGNACWTGHHFTNDIQTRQYRSPEVILGSKWGASTDVWSMSCMVFELITGDYLFDPQSGTKYGKDDDHIAQIIELLGPFPKSLCMSGKWSQEIFNRKGELRNIHRLRHWALPDVLKEKYHFKDEEARKVADFLTPMLELTPEKRANAGGMAGEGRVLRGGRVRLRSGDWVVGEYHPSYECRQCQLQHPHPHPSSTKTPPVHSFTNILVH